MQNWRPRLDSAQGIPRIIDVQTHVDPRGSLGVVEGLSLPFPIRRVYWLFDVPEGAIRGEHGHKRLEQLILCLNGQVEITMDDGSQRHPFLLSSASQGLHVPPGWWRHLRFIAPESVVCVLASRPYEAEDYIYRYDDFLAWVAAGRPGAPARPALAEGRRRSGPGVRGLA